ncbi:8-amino-7-oxononanoate synthase [bioreactor metagenome]|uniref:8-amino-7-oxononanoate synthase n=1 Tax=bioreactor metagenome TaxID=1076179 RepID=A0A644SWY0_9ZZZZ
MTDYLEQAQQQALYREVTTLEPVDAVHVRSDSRVYLNLASNNYLGLTHCPIVQQAASHAALTYGTGSGGARLITGNHAYYTKLEHELAAFKQTEGTVVFSTGYMANIGAISGLATQADVIFSDELNHASLIDGCRLAKARIVVYRHCDISHLAELMNTTPCQGNRMIITDGVFSMDGDIAPLPDLVKLAEQYKAILIVDDAHATGVIGPGGRGTTAHFGLEGKVQVQLGTLSKALGSEGGFVAGSRILIDYLINRARSFIFTTALSPATVAASCAALTRLKAQPALVATLQANALFTRQCLTKAGFAISQGITPIIPIPVGSAKLALAMAAELKSQGLLLSAIRPPTVQPGTSRLRLAVSAAHDQAELADAVCKITAVAQRFDIL